MAKRADDNGPFKAFEFEDWFWDSWKGCAGEFKHSQSFVFGEKFQTHMRHAMKEQLLAVRDLLDSVIEEIDRKAPDPEPKKA